MPSITSQDTTIVEVAGGVDTHQDTHTAAVIDAVGRVLGTEQFPTTSTGYAALLPWIRGFGRLSRVGVEGTGAYGAGLARLLREEAVDVVEVDRPDRRPPPEGVPSRQLAPTTQNLASGRFLKWHSRRSAHGSCSLRGSGHISAPASRRRNPSFRAVRNTPLTCNDRPTLGLGTPSGGGRHQRAGSHLAA
ncbi:transposase [Streptosporangium sp. NPDC000396]|uniref:IS110 family transposase n=1 Tax=Streptosporangium sp. NPDC000396 TaxID=3366185 RepID=UPI0036AF3A75